MDKNGRLVTKHVKAGVNHSTKNIPSPSLTSKVTGKGYKPTAKQLENAFYALDFNLYSPDSELLEKLEIDTSDYARFTANHVVFCDVLSVVSSDNAIVLMSREINSSADALQFLNEQGMSRLIKDYSWEADQIIQRKINPLSYAEISAKDRGSDSTPSWVVDAAEAHSIKSLREWQRYPSVPTRVLDGVIGLEDIKTIGVGRMIRADSSGDALIHSLAMIHKGKVSYNAHDVRELIDNYSAGTSEIYDMSKVMDMADRFGVEFTKNLFHPDYAFRMSSFLKGNQTKAKEIIEYADSICRYQSESGFQIGAPYADVAGLYEAGVSHEVAAEGIREGHSLNQIIAIHKEGVAPSVSGGWL